MSDSAYYAQHWQLRSKRGPARLHTCVDCRDRGLPGPARDWALIHGHDASDIWSYVPMCRRHHIRYDGSGHHQPHTEQARRKMSESVRLAYAEGRKVGQNTYQSGKTQCPAEHDYTEGNTYTAPDGSRACKECSREATRRWRDSRR